jgi:hypothetical protein
MKIKVITAYTDNYKSLFDYTSKSLISYCERNGYDFEGYLIPKEYTKLPSFYKIELLLKDLKDYDYVLWIDVDALIIRPDFKLESLFKNDRNLYISNTINFVNCGVMMFRKSEWSVNFLTDVKDYDVEKNIYNISRIDGWWEQAIIHDFFLSGRYATYHNVHIVNQTLFNAMLYNMDNISADDGQLGSDSFIFHLAGHLAGSKERPIGVVKKFEDVLGLYNLKWW